VVWGVWIPVVAYAGLIFGLSSIPDLPTPTSTDHLDKVAHFFEYGILGVLLIRASNRTLRRATLWVHVPLMVVIGAVLAALDETYQGTVGREQSLADWGADVAGLVAVAVIYVGGRSRGRFGGAVESANLKKRGSNP